MKRNIIKKTGTVVVALAALTMTSSVFAAEAKDTMCVKQKDGTYKCKASGTIMKEPCCETPSNEQPSPTPTPKK